MIKKDGVMKYTKAIGYLLISQLFRLLERTGNLFHMIKH